MFKIVYAFWTLHLEAMKVNENPTHLLAEQKNILFRIVPKINKFQNGEKENSFRWNNSFLRMVYNMQKTFSVILTKLLKNDRNILQLNIWLDH